MSYSHRSIMRWFIAVVYCAALSTGFTVAQNTAVNVSGNLIYARREVDVKTDFVSVASTSIHVFTLPKDHCTGISLDGTYLATTSLQRGDLIIRRFDTEEMIWQFPWAAEWEPCHLMWISDTVVSMGSASGDASYDLDVVTGQITLDIPPVYTPTPPPPLPNWETGNGALLSPDGNLYLYSRCTSGQTRTNPDGTYCVERPDWVIYNVSQQTPLRVLTDISMSWWSQFGDLFYAGATWSPDGRYLAYLGNVDFALRIYDVISRRPVDIDGVGGVRIDEKKGLHWSPDGTKIAVWVVGRLGEPRRDDDDNILRHLLIFDTTHPGAEGYTLANEIAYLGDMNVPPEKDFWSPDSQAFAFIDRNRALYYVDAVTGVTTLLDTNVERIIAWKPQVTSSATNET